MDPLPSCPQLFTTHFMKFHAIVSCHSAQAANSTSRVQGGGLWRACALCCLPTNVWQINADNVVSNDSPYSRLPHSPSPSLALLCSNSANKCECCLYTRRERVSFTLIDRCVATCHTYTPTPNPTTHSYSNTYYPTHPNKYTLTYTLIQRMFCRPNSLLVWIFGARFFRHFRPFVCPLMGLRPI